MFNDWTGGTIVLGDIWLGLKLHLIVLFSKGRYRKMTVDEYNQYVAKKGCASMHLNSSAPNKRIDMDGKFYYVDRSNTNWK